MSRVELVLHVDDIDTAVAFSSTLFQAQPAKRRPGYANFALEEPALKLVLIEKGLAGLHDGSCCVTSATDELEPAAAACC